MSKRFLLTVLTILFVFSACELAFEPAREYSLSTSRTGAGEISVEPDQEVYEPGDTLEVSATPDSGWNFSQWLGDIERETNPTTVIMDSNIAIVAQFIEEAAEYTLDIAVDGEGAVAIDPDQTAYVEGTDVTLQADPAAGWSFQGWVGDFESQENPFTIAMDSSITATAVFIRTSYILDTQTDGNGSIQRNPTQDLYEEGTEVQLIATPDAGWEFLYWFWNGDAMSSNDTTTITVTQDTTVRAVFEQRLLDDWEEELYEIFWTRREDHGVEVFNDRIFIFGGYQFDSGTFSDIYYNDVWSWAESDGINWTEEVDTASWAPRRDMATVVYDNQLWIIGGLTNNSSRENFGAVSDVWNTTDGVIWDRAADSTQTAFPGMSGHAAVDFNGRMYITGGYNSSSEKIYGRVYSSSDGVTWELETDSPGWQRANHASVVFDGKIWVIGGEEGTTFDNTSDVWSSPDGQNWTQVTSNAPWAARENHTCVVFGDRIWLMGGNSINGRENDIWYSEDGQTWTQVDPITEIWPARSGHGSVVYENNVWILGGSAAFDSYLRDIWKTYLPQ